MASDTANRSLTVQDYELVPVAMLKPHPKNPRKGDVSQIVESIKVNGFYGAVIAQKSTGHVLAGNHRIQAAKELGIADVPVIWVDCSDQEAEKILLVDNRTNDLAEYNDAALAEILAGLSNKGELKGTGYDESDLEALLAEMAGDVGTGGSDDVEPEEIDETRADEIQRKWGVKDGDIYEAGSHRLACGSCTDLEFVAKVLRGEVPMVITDPPYGINVVQSKQVGGGGVTKFGKVGGGKVVASSNYKPVANDDSVDAAEQFIAICTELGISDYVVWGGNYMTAFLNPSRCWIVWDKENTGNFADAELAWTSFDRGVRLYRWLWNGMSRKGDRATEGVSRYHPTQKPVGLHIQMLEDFNPDKRTVFDGFSGSGTTVLACANYGCPGIAIDMEPAYIAVALERLSQMGLEPRLVS